MKKNISEDQRGITTDQERRRLFLRYINRGWLIFGLITLVALPFFPEQRSELAYLLAVIFPSHLLMRLLNRSGRTRLAGVLFTIIVNFGFYGLFLVLVREIGAEEAFRTQATVWMLMGLAVLFAGALVDKWAAPAVALVNTILLVGTRLTLAPGSSPRPSVLVFGWMMAIIIWLYESTLERAFARGWNELAERKVTEAALRESERHYRLLAENVSDVIWTMDMNLRSTYTSPSVKRMRGYDAEDAIPQPLEEALTPASFKAAVKTLEEELAMEKLPERDLFRARTLELEVLRKDGSTIWVETKMTFLRDLDGNPVEILGVNRDITERKQAAEALARSEARFARIFEASPIPITLSRAVDGAYLAVNKSFLRFSGYTRDEVLGRTPVDIGIYPEPEMRAKLLSRFRESGRLENYEQPFRTKAGVVKDSLLWIESVTVNDETCLLALALDINERKRTEQALQDSQERLAGIIDSAMDAIISLDADQRITLFNPAAEQMFHCSADEAIGQTLDRFIPGRFRELHRERIRVFGQTGQTKRSMAVLGPLTCLRADGTEFPAEISISQIEMAEQKIYTAILRDITERERAAEKLNHRVSELTALYQTTLDLISAHDLPGLLNTIIARAVDLLGGTSGGLYLCDLEKKLVRCVVSYNTPEDYTGTVLAYGEGAAGTVANTGEPLIIEDYRTWKGRANAYEERQPFSAVISSPMLWQGQVTGVIHVLHDTEERKFTQEDLKLLTSFANHAAIAVENARLLEETQSRLERLSTLRQIDQVITNSLDLRVTLNILLGHILQQLKVDAATVLLYQPELQRLEFVAGQGFRTRALQSTNLRLGQGFAGQAALEQRMVQVSDLSQMQTGFLRSPEFRNEGFVTYVGVPLIAKGKITGVLEIYHRRPLDTDPEWMEFLETLAGQAAIAIDNIRLFEDLQALNFQLLQAYDATIEGWAKALELRDMEVEGHSQRAVDMTLELARKMGIQENQLTYLRWGALLHDIGKMGVPDAILQKPGALTDTEWDTIHQHPVYAYKWLSPISYLKPALDIPYCHHEKWDGSGYPRGLKGEQIPLAARIFAVIDVWDALTSDRPYRKEWSKEKALDYIKKESGKHFDPVVVETFLSLIDNE